MADEGLDRLFRDQRTNTALAWGMTALLVVVAVIEGITGDVLWAVFAGSAAVLALVPALKYRTYGVMLPWEVLALAALPVIGRTFATHQLTSDLAMYVSVAALALIVAVELHVFTPVEMTVGFAVLFVVVTTMAASGIWAVVRWLWDVQFGTGFIESEHDLMWEFVYSTGAGVLAGLAFELQRRRSRTERLPDDVTADIEDQEVNHETA